MRRIASARGVLANAVWLAALYALIGGGWVASARAQNAVCADVKIEIKQKLSLERQAFDAVMRINNGLQTDAIQSVGVNLTFRIKRATALSRPPIRITPAPVFSSALIRLTALVRSMALAVFLPKTTGEIHWLDVDALASEVGRLRRELHALETIVAQLSRRRDNNHDGRLGLLLAHPRLCLRNTVLGRIGDRIRPPGRNVAVTAFSRNIKALLARDGAPLAG
jgi:hypothetical protein